MYGGSGDDFVTGGLSDDSLYGSYGLDPLWGGDGNDSLHGGSGDDLLIGGNGNDRLIDTTGNDTLNGAAGDDHLEARLGNDHMTGGLGADTFVFQDGFGTDTIGDFDLSTPLERIDLTAVTLISNFADLQAHHMTQIGNHTLIFDGDGNSVRLNHIDMTLLTSDHFVF